MMRNTGNGLKRLVSRNIDMGLGGIKGVRVWLILLLMIVMLFSIPNCVQAAVATPSPSVNAPIDIMSLAPDIQGYNAWIYNTESYDAYVAHQKALNWPHADSYLGTGGTPDNFLLVKYNTTQTGIEVWVEIYEYPNASVASAEYNYEYNEGNRGDIFNRFYAESVLLHRGPFMVFLSYYTKNWGNDPVAKATIQDFAQKYIDNLFTILPESTQPSPDPSRDSGGNVVWGVKPGDNITWAANSTTFTGYVGGGMGHTQTSDTITLEVLRISDDTSSILLKSPTSKPSDFDYYVYWMPINLVLPQYEYFWQTDNVKKVAPFPLIFPIYSNGQTLKDVIKSQYTYNDNEMTEDAEDIHIHSSTPYLGGYGFTQTVTGWVDVTVQKGSGIVTGYSFYYNDNKNYITTSSNTNLINTNFDLNSRMPMPTIIPSTPTANTPSTPVPKPSPFVGVEGIGAIVLGAGIYMLIGRKRN